MTDISEKSRLRAQSLLKRESIAPRHRKSWALSCCARIVQTVRAIAPDAAVIAGYAPIQSELDVMPALLELAAHYSLALPVIGKEDGRRQLTFHPWKPGEKLAQKTYGIREPIAPATSVIPDIVIVPLLAFDRSGHRLGYGGGYYDGVLRKLRAIRPQSLAIGAAFSLQEERLLPAGAYDERINKIVTEKEVISIG